MLKKFMALSEEKKTLAVLLAISLAVFACLCPFFFLSLGQYPIGWITGSLIACVCYLSMYKGNEFLLSMDGKKGAAAYSVLLYFSRFLLMGAGLVVAAVCTYKSEWFGGFDAFNFWTVFAGYLLLFVLVPVKTFIASSIANKKEQRGREEEK